MQKRKLEYRRLERIIKGFSSHRRLEILELLKREPESSVEDISKKLSMGYKNTSDHIRRMAIANLIMKRNDGPAVRHKLTPLGESILVFCRTLE